MVCALVNLATAIHEATNRPGASKIYRDAYSRYTEIHNDPKGERRARMSLWTHLGYLPPDVFNAAFNTIFKKTIELKDYDYGELDRFVNQAMSDRENDKDNSSFDKKEFIKNAVNMQTALVGKNSSDLEFLLECYAQQCEQSRDLEEAESTLRRITTLNESMSAGQRTASKIGLMEFFLRHQMFAKADEYWSSISGSLVKAQPQWIASNLERLAENYINAGKSENALNILKLLLQTGGHESLYSINNLTERLVSGKLNNGDLKGAQQLLSLRVAASKRIEEDGDASRWYLKLSDVELALGNTQESQKLFNQVKIFTALQHGDVDKLIADREKLIKTLKK